MIGGCGGTSCYWGYTFDVTSWPFVGNAPCFGLSPTSPIGDGSGNIIGFSHEIWGLGGPVDAGFEDRPWVVSWEIGYCMSSTEQDCEGSTAIAANGAGSLRFGFIMYPGDEPIVPPSCTPGTCTTTCTSCEDCALCAQAAGGECHDHYAACIADADCLALWECSNDVTCDATCIDECIDPHYDGLFALGALGLCVYGDFDATEGVCTNHCG